MKVLKQWCGEGCLYSVNDAYILVRNDGIVEVDPSICYLKFLPEKQSELLEVEECQEGLQSFGRHAARFVSAWLKD